MGSSLGLDLPPELQGEELPYSLTAASATHKNGLLTTWRDMWAKSPQQQQLDKIDTKMLSSSFLRVTDGFTRVQASILMQLCIGHVPLNKFLQPHRQNWITTLLALSRGG